MSNVYELVVKQYSDAKNEHLHDKTYNIFDYLEYPKNEIFIE